MKAASVFLAAVASAVLRSFAGPDEAGALERLLNSRSSGATKAYAGAAEQVAKEAAAGKILQQYVVALFSMDPDAPGELRIFPETREEYFKSSRNSIRKFAEKTANPLALYLVSIENDDPAMLRRAAELGNVQAMNALGTRLFNEAESSGPPDAAALFAEAYSFFSRAADLGDANGLNNRALCLQNGWGCAADDKRAFDDFSRAAKAGHPEAVNNLGRFYREGVVVEKNLRQAAIQFARSASAGCDAGSLNYAAAMLEGEGLRRDPAEAVLVLRKLAEKGNPDAMDLLSRCCDKGLGCEENPAASAEWAIRARAARGDANAAKWIASKEAGK